MPHDPNSIQPLDQRFLVGTGCLECKHLIDLVESTCEAFPEGIPLDILQDRVRHDASYPGDHGVRFERTR
jgi:hypothetical protein